MAHTKRKQMAKVKRKIAIGGKIENNKEKNELKIAKRINDYVDTLIGELQNRIQYFQKEIHRIRKKVGNIKIQEEKAAAKIIQLESNLIKLGTPAARKRLDTFKASSNKLTIASLEFNINLYFLGNELNHLNHHLHQISALRKTMNNASELRQAMDSKIRVIKVP